MSTSIEMSQNGSIGLESIPRLCHLRKWPEHDHGSLGFNLITKKSGHFIERIDIGSPAYYCGLKDGDKIHEINGKNVIKLSHKIVANMIAESTSTGVAKLLVTDHDTEARLKASGLEITSGGSDYQVKFIQCPDKKPDDGIMNNRKDSKGPELNPAFEFDDHGTAPTGYKNQPPARLCHLTKYSSEPNFGFIVRTYSDNGEKVVLQLDEDGVAARSGVRKGDYIIEINGFNILKDNHNQVINRILDTRNVLKLLVVSEAENKWYKARGLIPRESHSIEYRTETKDGQRSSDRNFPDRSRSANESLGPQVKDTSLNGNQRHSNPQERETGTSPEPRGDWCGTKSEVQKRESKRPPSPKQESIKKEEVNYSTIEKPYDGVIEELEGKFSGGQDVVNGASNGSQSDEELPLNDMTLGNQTVAREESVISTASAVSEKIKRFEVSSAQNGNGEDRDADGEDQEPERKVIDSALPGLNKSVKEMREELESGKKKRRGKMAPERMI